MQKHYVRKTDGGSAYVADIDSPLVRDGLRRKELVLVYTVRPEDVRDGRVTPEEIRSGRVVVTDGDELKPDEPDFTGPNAAAQAMDWVKENGEQEERYAREQEAVDERQKEIDMSTVGPGGGKAMTVDAFLASGQRGYIRKSELTGYHSVDNRLILSGRVRVIPD